MYMVNVLNNIVDSDFLIYILIFILACISIAMLYLIYAQNKRVNEEIKQRQLQRELDEKYLEEEKKSEIVQPVDMSIPDKLEFTKTFYINDAIDLKNITKELETLPKERKINMTPYEEEQEESAIISYEELLSKTNKLNLEYDNKIDREIDELSLTSDYVDIVDEKKIIENASKNDILPYEHEEEFLRALKQLQKMIN